MPNRILKETICTSENIDALSAFQETVFYRLLVNCDDFGRMDARAKLLASKLFPLKDIRPAQIEDALRALTSAELVILYEVDGKPFLQMKTWDRHQNVRAQKSKYPAPSDGKIAYENICKQLQADASKCPRNPIQYESNPNPNPNPNTNMCADALNTRFESFWSSYPRHTAKQNALKAFAKLNPDDDLLSVMLQAIERQKKSSQWQGGEQFIPHPATWINGKRWEDDIVTERQKPAPATKTVTAQQYEQREYSKEYYAAEDKKRMQDLLERYGYLETEVQE